MICIMQTCNACSLIRKIPRRQSARLKLAGNVRSLHNFVIQTDVFLDGNLDNRITVSRAAVIEKPDLDVLDVTELDGEQNHECLQGHQQVTILIGAVITQIEETLTCHWSRYDSFMNLSVRERYRHLIGSIHLRAQALIGYT